MATFFTDMMEKGYSQNEVLAVLFESEREKKRREMLAIVTKTVDVHRLEKMRELLAYEKLATLRRMIGFDRDVDRVYDWRSLPPTPQEYNASLRYELQKLKNAISMPNEEYARLKRLVEKREDFGDEELQKKMAEFRSDSLDELLANFEFARVKEYVEKRGREAAQVTVTPVDTVQHFSSCSPNPDMPSDVCFKLRSMKGKIYPERGELESSSAGTGLETPGQQCLPNEGTWVKGEPPPPASWPRVWVQTKGETFFHLRRKAWTRKPVTKVRELRQTSPSCSRVTNPEAKRTSCLTPVEKERRHRLGTRL